MSLLDEYYNLTFKSAVAESKKMNSEDILKYVQNNMNKRKNVLECRGKSSNAKDNISKLVEILKYGPPKFIIIDGPPCMGKSTAAKKIKEKYKNFEIVEIDDLVEKVNEDIIKKEDEILRKFWEENSQLKNASINTVEKEKNKLVEEMQERYIINNIERIVEMIAKRGKSCILVVYSRCPLNRILYFNFLGKYFKETISMYMVSEELKEFGLLIRGRMQKLEEAEKKYDVAEIINMYNLAVELLKDEKEKNLFLNSANDLSFLVDSCVIQEICLH